MRFRLFFDALDLVVGLRLGDDRSLKRRDWLERMLIELQENLPFDVASQVIPRSWGSETRDSITRRGRGAHG